MSASGARGSVIVPESALRTLEEEEAMATVEACAVEVVALVHDPEIVETEAVLVTVVAVTAPDLVLVHPSAGAHPAPAQEMTPDQDLVPHARTGGRTAPSLAINQQTGTGLRAETRAPTEIAARVETGPGLDPVVKLQTESHAPNPRADPHPKDDPVAPGALPRAGLGVLHPNPGVDLAVVNLLPCLCKRLSYW